MDWLNGIKRFAGDRLEDLKAGYNAADNQFGGILPGGVDIDPGAIIRTAAKDALPGKNVSSFTKNLSTTGIKSGLAADAVEGNISRVATRARAGKAAAGFREGLTEEGVERVGKKIINNTIKDAATRKAFGAFVPGLNIYDAINDGKNAYSGVLEVTTGRNLEENMALAADKRDPLYGISEPGTSIMPADGSIPTIKQGPSFQMPVMQEVSNRVSLAAENFNPMKGEWGVSELLYGK